MNFGKNNIISINAVWRQVGNKPKQPSTGLCSTVAFIQKVFTQNDKTHMNKTITATWRMND